MDINLYERVSKKNIFFQTLIAVLAPTNEAYKLFGKRVFDFLFALLAIILLAPVISVLCVVTALDGGNPFFGHRRIGKNGTVFKCWKIRTMVIDAEQKLQERLRNDPIAAAEWVRDYKLTNDPRITPFGNFLRRTSLDELPQLWNVLKGDMSIVGPRPVVRTELHKYGSKRAIYLSLKPGITGLWQVSGRNAVNYDVRVKLDSDYVESLSLWKDLGLIVLTILAMLQRTGR